MSKYVIKQNTMYIRGVKVDDHTIHTEVSEAGKEPFIVKQKPQEIMNQSCRFYGEHFNERKLLQKANQNHEQTPDFSIRSNFYLFFLHRFRKVNRQHLDKYTLR